MSIYFKMNLVTITDNLIIIYSISTFNKILFLYTYMKI